jgi:hypothetical protein
MKNSMHTIKRTLFALLISVVCFASYAPYSQAQSVLPFTISPARQQITINPGEEAQLSVKFYNQSDVPVSGLVKVADFIVDDDKGTPRIVEDVSQASPKYSASEWITLPFDRMNIAANDKTIVQATLKVPQDARPGGRYAAIYFEPTTAIAQPVGEAGASITPRIASLLYIRVQGPMTEYAFISNMFSRSFYEYGPIEVTAQITNKGDYHVRPRGTFTLSNAFGGMIEQTSVKEANIFPDALRSFTATVGTKWMAGRYKISLNTLYGEQMKAADRSIYVWVFPWRAAIVVVLGLLILWIIGRSIYKNIVMKEMTLEEELSHDRAEIEKLKKQLNKRE